MNKIEKPNYTQVPNIILDNMHELTGSEFKIIMLICRKTFGWHKEKDKISLSQITKNTGIGKTQAVKALKNLENKGLISTKKQQGNTTEFELVIESKSELVQKVNTTCTESEQVLPQTSSESEHTKESIKETNKRNIYYTPELKELFNAWLQLGLSQHNENVVKNNIFKKHIDTFEMFTLSDWKKIISDYQIVTTGDSYYYNHWFSFWDFIARGYKQFLPELKPLENFKIKNKKTDQDILNMSKEERIKRIEKMG